MRRWIGLLVLAACGSSTHGTLPVDAAVISLDGPSPDAAASPDAVPIDAAPPDAPPPPDAPGPADAAPVDVRFVADAVPGTTIGDTTPYPLTDIPNNYLLGTTVEVTSAVTVVRLGINAASTKPAHVTLALYENTGGTAGHLVAFTASTVLLGGIQEIDVTPVAIQPGTYWTLASSDEKIKIGEDNSGAQQWWILTSHTYGTALPDPFPQGAPAFEGGPANLWLAVP